MELIEKQIYTFPIKETTMMNGGLYAIVSVNGFDCPVRLFDFQKGDARPSQLSCIFKGYNAEHEPMLMQDVAPLLKQIYKIGEVYDFKVRSDYSSRGYYEVTDSNGFILRLTDYGKQRLYEKQTIKARVLSIKLIRVELQLVGGTQQQGPRLMTEDEVLALCADSGHAAPLLRFLFHHLLALREALDQLNDQNALWPITAVDSVDHALTEWLTQPRHNGLRQPLLKAFREICVNLIEQSDYLAACSQAEALDYRRKVAVVIQRADDYLDALRILDEGCSKQFVDSTLQRLSLSGYLYQPEKRMRTLMSLFNLSHQSVQSYIQNIFDIISRGHDRPQFMRQFSQAFVEMLEMYIRDGSKAIDNISSVYDDNERQRVSEMIKALAIELLLIGDDEHEDKKLWRSMLYRLAAVFNRGNAERLLRKSFDMLFSSPRYGLEFGWSDIANVPMLCAKLSAAMKSVPVDTIQAYHGVRASMTISSDGVAISPVARGYQLRKAYPDGITPWLNIQFLLNDRLQEKVSPEITDSSRYRMMWTELERSLFAANQNISARPPRRKLLPDVGDEVSIIVTGAAPGRKYDLQCRVVEPGYEGEGILDTHRIVHYNVDGDPQLFCERKSGQPYVFKASVESTNPLRFTMEKQMAKFINDDAQVGDSVLAKVTLRQPYNYVCITELGYSLSVQRKDAPDDLRMGEFFIATIDAVRPNGNIDATFVERSSEIFYTTAVFHNMMVEYAGEKVYHEETDKVEEDEVLPEKLVDKEDVEQFIHIMDCYAMAQSDNLRAYNYLSVVRILSLMIGNTDEAAYYEKRLRLLLALMQFGEVGRISDEELEMLLNDDTAFIDNYPEYRNKLAQLQIINRLGKPCNDEFLWQQVSNTDNNATSPLARLVMSYNMLDGLSDYATRKGILTRIYRLMDLNVRIPDTLFVAEEDQFTELKTSLVYPASNSMRADERQQLKELMTVVCSFLNAKGGTLYIGVNNTGYASGLENDFVYLNQGQQDYDLADVKDKFDRKFRDAVHNMLGQTANEHVDSTFMLVGEKKLVYRVEVTPTERLIQIEGKAYVRQGTSKWEIPSTQTEQFRRNRERLFKAQLTSL